MRKIIRLTGVFLLLFICSGRGGLLLAQPMNSGNILTLDAAIGECASYFITRLSANVKVAMVPFEAPTGRLSDYIFEEMWSRIEDSQKFVMVDRRNLQRIDAEVQHQLGSGRVDEEMVVSLTKQYGAEILIHGQMTPLGQGSAGPEYRMTIYATDVEKAASSQRALVVRSDNRLVSLLNASLDDQVERAVSAMARAVNQKITIAVGRISYGNTQTVTNLSAWLKNSIISSAQKQRDKFQVASESESAEFAVASRGFTEEVPASPIQAVITGYYSPLDSGAEVSLHLVSTRGNKVVLASAQFAVSVSELERRRLSLLPEKDKAVISLSEFEAKQQAVAPYTGQDNPWDFTISPNALDGIYHDGEFMFLSLYSAKDCYFRIIHVDVNGKTQVIYPAAAGDNNFIKAGQLRRIPDNSLYLLGAPYGEEIILAAAYDHPFTARPLSGAAPFSAEIITRGFTVEGDDSSVMNPSVTAQFSYTILAK